MNTTTQSVSLLYQAPQLLIKKSHQKYYVPFARWRGYVDSYHHLLAYSSVSFIITATAGVGKTTFVTHLQDRLADVAHSYYLRGDDQTSASHITSIVQNAFAKPPPQASHPPLLIIDDAHELPVTTLDFLVMQTQRPTQGVTGLRFMLCGNDSLLQKLAELPISHETLAHHFHQLTLLPLSLAEMMEYLTKRLSLTQQSLSPAQWRQIHQLADGHIETMLVLAKKMQRDRFARKITSFRRNTISRWYGWIIGLFFIVLAATLWWGYQSNQSSTAATQSIASHESTTAQSANAPTIVSPDSNNQMIPHVNTQTESTTDKNEEAMRARQQQLDLIKQELALILIDRKINYVDISKTSFLAMSQKRAQRVGYKESILRAMGEAQLMQAHSAMVQTKKNEVAQQPSGYTIQLLATHNEQALREFIARHQLEEQTRYFSVLRKEERWYVLTFGQYSTLQAAQRALSTLPPALQVAKPWPRSLASLQTIHTEKE